jgi:hypothetical protein
MPEGGESRELPKAAAPQEVREAGFESRERPPGAPERPVPVEQPAVAELPAAAPAPAPVAVAVIAKDAYRMKIERVLENGLVEIYVALPPDRRQAFKLKGEETAAALRAMLDQTKINFGKVLDLIRAWLKIIPRVNRYFLEQEAKIKADKIFMLHTEIHNPTTVS